ncbi:hypothetical protein F5Y05DRAFT_212849 [Hypoxylon sp. FL0543]|nr:hypothetical protein F5Y05DRAFT_212849 [Hypoxylon sp. FL0543]
MEMAKTTLFYSSWLANILIFLVAIGPFADAISTESVTISRSASANVPLPTGTFPKPSGSPKRIVQYAHTIYAPSSLSKVHITELVNSTRPIYATDVIYGTWAMSGI